MRKEFLNHKTKTNPVGNKQNKKYFNQGFFKNCNLGDTNLVRSCIMFQSGEDREGLIKFYFNFTQVKNFSAVYDGQWLVAS